MTTCKDKCPFFKRKVQGTDWYGFKCTANFAHGETMGRIGEWSKEKRDKILEEKCHGDYQNCRTFQHVTTKEEK